MSATTVMATVRESNLLMQFDRSCSSLMYTKRPRNELLAQAGGTLNQG